MLRRRSQAPSVPGEKVLAWCTAQEPEGAVLAGTREALHLLPEGRRLPWHQIQTADWDRDDAVLRVSEVGAWGELRPEHTFVVSEPGRLLELIRERVTATIVLQRRVLVGHRRGISVVARRTTTGDRDIAWFYEYDEGVDPDDPAVKRLAAEALARAREEVGLG